MTPTREQFQAVAEWLGITVNFDLKGYAYTDGWQSETWKPHLPGDDCFALMAALECDINWCAEAPRVNVTAWGKDGNRISSPEIDYDNTPDSKLQALASAVWQCAVKVAMEAKKS